jgi:hypothetical protein
MRLAQERGVLMAWLFLSAGGSALAQYEIGIPVPNWTVPPYGGSRPAGGLSTMTDISPGIAFVAVQPCRVFDTRNANGPYGGPRLLGNTTRNFDIDSGPCTGIPTGVDAYSMNFGAILPDGANSFVTIWPTGSAQPVVSTINPIQGGVVANAAIVPAGTNGSISVFPNTGMHLYGDINGYFTDEYNPSIQVRIVANVGNDSALHVENTASFSGSRAVLGLASGATGITWGVLGHTDSDTPGSAGVRGVATAGFGAGTTYGVMGVTSSNGPGSAGVHGDGGGSGSGVSGFSGSGYGVFGASTGRGVVGQRSGGASGYLGFTDTVGVIR